MGTIRLIRPLTAVDRLCLHCRLAECDDGHPECAWRAATGGPIAREYGGSQRGKWDWLRAAIRERVRPGVEYTFEVLAAAEYDRAWSVVRRARGVPEGYRLALRRRKVEEGRYRLTVLMERELLGQIAEEEREDDGDLEADPGGVSERGVDRGGAAGAEDGDLDHRPI